ncbi:hypothetical protein SDC9_98948 [bioreactor metagenome]|uniref:ASCH domain-containing protein n=1 Tax=bioreactor metagenome TaxID=1076179 RepID=A0A645AG51_9ZZZZ
MKPILFSTPMVEAILGDRKSMTRRVITELPKPYGLADSMEDLIALAKPRYLPGDVLWVRETFCLGKVECGENPDGSDAWYIEPDDDGGIIPKQWAISHDIGMDDVKWRPSIFMPKEFARIFLRVIGVRAEQVCDITEDDARAEGIGFPLFSKYDLEDYGYAGCFEMLWDHLNEKRGYGWDKNPWVWVYKFERIERPEEQNA